ncbi:MAG: hypothetical protein BMS9Abin36_0750 [Gammaproteobacteria bacterium]|nr:MAG: hypothetical protein BMS9Abin36_0750 [Gammaproteobacteria bacterium]
MNRAILLLVLVITTSNSHAAMVVPLPTLDNVQVDAAVVFNTGTELYEYEYTILNPDTNTGNIRSIWVSITRPKGSVSYDTEELSLPYAATDKTYGQTRTFGYLMNDNINSVDMIPVGVETPKGWYGSIAALGYAMFNHSSRITGGVGRISPGGSLGGLRLLSRGVPTIRKIKVIPLWKYVSDTPGGITREELEESLRLREAVVFRTHSIGPSAVLIGHFRHWNQLRDDLVKAIDLGWIPDNALANSLQSLLAEARALLDADDGTAAKASMQAMLDALAQATPGQIDAGASDLVRLNVLALMQYTPIALVFATNPMAGPVSPPRHPAWSGPITSSSPKPKWATSCCTMSMPALSKAVSRRKSC